MCPPQDTDVKFVPNAPILTDKQPILEYHLGREYHQKRAQASTP